VPFHRYERVIRNGFERKENLVNRVYLLQKYIEDTGHLGKDNKKLMNRLLHDITYCGIEVLQASHTAPPKNENVM